MEYIRKLLGTIMYGIYMFLDVFGVNNAALCIILFTILVKALMLPLNIKQQKFTKLSSVMNPEIQKVQAKYKGKSDRESLEKQQKEMQIIYDKFGTSPTAGCLPMLITLPIIFALYGIINDIPNYVAPINDLYEAVANAIKGSNIAYNDIFKKYAETYSISYSDNINGMVDVLQKLSRNDWKTLLEQFSASSSCVDVIETNSTKIIHINSFLFGLNISERPSMEKWYSMLIPVFSVLTQWYQTKQMSTTNNQTSANDNPTMQSMQMMTKVMPFISGIFCLFVPIGLGIYWITNSVFQIGQQYFVNKHMDKMDMDELINENVARSKNKKKKNSMSDRLKEKLLDATQEDTSANRALRDYANINSKKADLQKSEKSETVNKGSSSNDVDNTDKVRECNKGSISSYANIMNTKNTK